MAVGVQVEQGHQARSDATPAVQYHESFHVRSECLVSLGGTASGPRSPAVVPRRRRHGQGPDAFLAFGFHRPQDHHRVIPVCIHDLLDLAFDVRGQVGQYERGGLSFHERFAVYGSAYRVGRARSDVYALRTGVSRCAMILSSAGVTICLPFPKIQPLVVLFLREPTRDQVKNFGRGQGKKFHVSTSRAAGETRAECQRASYAASSFGASWRHSSSFSTRLRPYLPISARRAGSSSSSTIFAARSKASFFCA